MLSDIWSFAVAVRKHWVSAVIGSGLAALLAILRGTGHVVPPYAYWILVIGGLFIAFFLAWRDEFKAKNEALAEAARIKSDGGAGKPGPEVWADLYNEKKRLEDELEVELDAMESLQPLLLDGMQPDDPNSSYWPPAREAEYRKRKRRAERIKGDIEIIKEKLGGAPQGHS